MPNKLDLDYQSLLKDILDNGSKKNTRNGKTISVFGRQIRHDMQTGFPLLTTKKMYFKGIVTELLWFLQGRSDLRYLLKNDCHIWTGDAYKRYEQRWIKENSLSNYSKGLLSVKEFEEKILADDDFDKIYGDLGEIYGKQWRNWKHTTNLSSVNCADDKNIINTPTNIYIDQLAELIKELKSNPDSRRLLVSAWNVGDIYTNQMILPPCHHGFQIYTRELSPEQYIRTINNHKLDAKKNSLSDFSDPHHTPTRAISLMFNMRSVDVPLGLPFNIASYGLLLEILAKITNMVPDQLIGNLGDCHIYENQIKSIKEQLTRKPYKLPYLIHKRTDSFYKSLGEDLNLLNYLDKSDFILSGYQCHSTIKIPLSN